MRLKGSAPTRQEAAFADLSPTDAARSVWIADALNFDPRGAAIFGALSDPASLAASLAFLAPPLIAVSAVDPEASAALAALAARSSPTSRVVAGAPDLPGSVVPVVPSSRRRKGAGKDKSGAPLPKPAP